MRYSLQTILFSLLLLNVLGTSISIAQETSLAPAEVIARVNGQELTAGDLQLEFFSRQVSGDQTSRSQTELLQNLINRKLVDEFLEKRKVNVDQILLEQRMNAVKKLIEDKGDKLDEVLQKLGLDETALEGLISRQIAWQTYVHSIMTETQIDEHWKEHKERFDGTEVVAAQIFRRVAVDAAEPDVMKELAELRRVKSQIESNELTFAEAAKKYSQSPSGKTGGNLGSFEYFGSVAESIAQAAFSTSPGKISEPFRSQYGLHLVMVSEKKPGDLSLEDARPVVVRNLAEQLWQQTVERLRSSARIQVLIE